MNKLSKVLSVVLALVLCTGTVIPAFAQDAYYYVKISADDVQKLKKDENSSSIPEETDPDAADPVTKEEPAAPGNGYNPSGSTAWAFMGQGSVPDEVTTKTILADGVLPEGYITPSAGEEQTFNGGDYQDNNYNVDVTVEQFHDIGKYAYDDGTSETVPQFTYTVTWTQAGPAAGFNLNASECTSVSRDPAEGTVGNIRFQAGNTIHVDGEASLHENQTVNVVIKNYEDETGTKADVAYYVREDANAEDQAVAAAVAKIVAALGNEKLNDTYYNVETKEEDSGFVTTYTEKTYTVTYQANDLLSFAGTEETYGKTQEHTALDGLDTVYVPGVGTYAFTGWVASEPDENGNIVYTADVSFAREVVYDYESDFGFDELEIEIEEEGVPLSGLFTRADTIGYLWQQAGSPDAGSPGFADVPEDHEWAAAIGWAQDMGIAVADEDGNFRPDDLVLRSSEETDGEMQEFLNRYAVYTGIELNDGDLFVVLDGAADDVIMGEDAQAIFDDFFVKLMNALS